VASTPSTLLQAGSRAWQAGRQLSRRQRPHGLPGQQLHFKNCKRCCDVHGGSARGTWELGLPPILPFFIACLKSRMRKRGDSASAAATLAS
jgi:hypothetical protein